VENKPPRVQIGVPSDLSPGKEISLSTSVKEDPDGEVVDTDWSPSSTITVPTNGTLGVTVTVSDDKGAIARDSIELTGKTETIKEDVAISVYCYYTNDRQRVRENPHHCEEPAATLPRAPDGFSSAPAGYENYQRSDQYTVIWKKVPEGETIGDLAENEIEGRPSDLNESAYRSTQVDPGIQVKGQTYEQTNAESLVPFSMNGKTVKSDLTGDGEINAADWDQRYGSAEKNPDETHEKAVTNLKNTQESRETSDGGSSSDNGSSNSSTDSGNSDRSESDSNTDSTDNNHKEVVDDYKNSQRSSSSSSSSSSNSSSNKSSTSSLSNYSSSNSGSTSSNSQTSGGLNDDIDYTGGLGETSKGGTGHATHNI